MHNRKLVLEDGTTFTGKAFGGGSETEGEVIFNTGMTGYQEILSDPNYFGHIAVMTYPTIGAYGINRDDFEAITPFMNGMIVKELTEAPSNFRSEETLDQFMKEYNIPGISGIDTRMLTRHLRNKGTMRGKIMDVTENDVTFTTEEEMLAAKTSVSKPYIVPGSGLRIVVIDLGMKQSVLHELTNRACDVTVVPYNYKAEEIMRFKPDGVLLSNGPGNPALLTETVETISALLGKVPLFGIGLGHQLFALSCGAKTSRLHVGNYGTSFPVKDLQTDQTWLTTQSRLFYVDESSLAETELDVTFRSINDGTVEGLSHRKFKAISVQFNPEGAPGASETNYLFDTFLTMIDQNRVKNGVEKHA